MPDKEVLIEVNKPSQLWQAMQELRARRAYDVAAKRWRMPVTDDDFHSNAVQEGEQ